MLESTKAEIGVVFSEVHDSSSEELDGVVVGSDEVGVFVSMLVDFVEECLEECFFGVIVVCGVVGVLTSDHVSVPDCDLVAIDVFCPLAFIIAVVVRFGVEDETDPGGSVRVNSNPIHQPTLQSTFGDPTRVIHRIPRSRGPSVPKEIELIPYQCSSDILVATGHSA